MNTRQRRELFDHIERLFLGDLNPDESQQLARQLAEDPEARDFYARLVRLDVGLAWSFGTQPQLTLAANPPISASLSPPLTPSPRLRFAPSPLVWSILAASLLFAAYFIGISWNMLGRERSDRLTELQSPLSLEGRGVGGEGVTVATITASEDANWSPHVGKSLRDLHSASRRDATTRAAITPGEPLAISSGLVELQLKQGTTLLIEGPADWEINGENSATLTHGRLVAKVPQQAIGFTLETPTAKIIDLGTEFGVEVAKDGVAEVHVVQGKIDIRNSATGGKQSNPLKAGESAQITKVGEVVPTHSPAVPDKFKRLVAAGNKNSSTPNPAKGLISYYPFDGDTKDHAADFAANSGQHEDDLKLFEKGEFLAGQVGRALRLTGGYASAPFSTDIQLPPTFTIEAWIVAERLAGFQRLVANWRDFPSPIYVYHFNIKEKALELAVGQANGQVVRVTGGEMKIERWQHVAAVSDGSQLRLYLNGEEVATGNFDGTLLINDQEGLGIGDNAGGTGDIHRLHGAIDELAIWNVALTAEQIVTHARSGTRGYRLIPLPKSP